MKKILVTGASGFIGQSLCNALLKKGKLVCGTIRPSHLFKKNCDITYVPLADISNKTNWKNILVDVDCIIHCAARAHIMHEKDVEPLKIYRSVNVDGTRQLATQAADAGIKRFIFLSSIKVNGENTDGQHNDTKLKKKQNSFKYSDIPNPKDPYAQSKFEAEKILWEISNKSDLEVTVVRLPLVYGYGVKGNLLRLIKLIKFGIPLPLSMVKNQRSMIGLDNLVDFLIRCIDRPEAVGETFLVSDGEDLSTSELINYMAFSMGRTVRLFPVPSFLLKLFAHILGKKKEINRLLGSLTVDSSYAFNKLDWKPPLSVEEGIRRMIQN